MASQQLRRPGDRVSAYLMNGQVYVVAVGWNKDFDDIASGEFVTCGLTAEELTQAIQAILGLGRPYMPDFRIGLVEHPLLYAVGVRNWNALYRRSVSYHVDWYGDKTTISMSKSPPNAKESDPLKKRILPPSTPPEPLLEIVRILLDDMKTRAEAIATLPRGRKK